MTLRRALRHGAAPIGAALDELTDGLRRLTLEAFGLYGAAAMRIGLAGLYLLSLVRELGHADRLWGPGSPYTPELFAEARRGEQLSGGPLSPWYGLLGTDSAAVFWLLYAAATLVCLLYLLGWHTRLMAVLFCAMATAFYIRGNMADSGWERLSLVFGTYLVLCASGRRWSLDARRLRRRGTGRRPWGVETEELRRRVVTALHNGGMAIIAFQVMVGYTAAAMYKIQGEAWRDGTALHYVLLADDFSSWPALSGWITGHGDFLAVMTYLTVFTQMFFASLVFNRRLKYCVLALMLGSHLGIAVLMGLPMFSAVMVVGDLVFLPTSWWLGAARLVRTLHAPAGPDGPEPDEPDGSPPAAGTPPRDLQREGAV